MKEGSDQERRLKARSFVALLVASFSTIAALLARNPVGIPHVERLIGLGLVVWVLGCLLAWLLRRLGGAEGPSVLAAFVAISIVMSGRPLVESVGAIVTGLVIVGLTVCITWLGTRVERLKLASVVLAVLLAAQLASPILDLTKAQPWGTSLPVNRDPALGSIHVIEPRDLYLIVLDGHPGLKALEQDYEPSSTDRVVGMYEDAGFELARSAWAAFRSTHYSVPSVLNMNYPIDDLNESPPGEQSLYDAISGENEVLDVLSSNGYMTYMVEAGWSGSSCRSQYKTCVASPVLDEAMFNVLAESVFGPAVASSFGYAFTAGTERSLSWLSSAGPVLDGNGEPDFVFAHAMSPHPPFFFDSECRRVVENRRSGVTFVRTGVPDDERGRYLTEQLVCLSASMAEFANSLSPNSVVVVISDHGTDRRGQLTRHPSSWSAEDTVERMNVLVAVRGLDGCVPSTLILPNLMRHILSCLSGQQVETIGPRMFLGQGVELDETRVQDLLIDD